ncbi:MAG: hypothetical protein QW775_06230 [Ignisphaera sp.]|uniref:ABC transmembrane type-1 domain-containing protein n=1 Tax=Ignisphaera aggregans TaxID=334771 RepID=A0A7C4NTD7_9CREN
MSAVEYIDVPAYVIMTILGVALSFWGKQLARILSSIVFSAFLSYLTWIHSFRLWNSVAISTLLMLIAIVVGFLAGFLIYKLAISTLFAYIATGILIPSIEKGILFLLVMMLLIAIVYILSGYILSLLFALTGTIMIYKGITTLGLNGIAALIVCIIILVLGFYNQVKSKV